MTTRTTILCSIPLTLALAACAPMATDASDNPPGEQPGATQRVVSGDTEGDDPAFGGSGTLAAATSVRIVSVASGGGTTTHGEADVEADGSFSVDATGMDNREHYVIQLMDDADVVIGAAHFDGEDSDLTQHVDATTSVSAMAWMSAREQGEDIGDDAYVDSHVTAEVVASLQAMDDADANVQAAIDAFAQAAAAADDARASFATELGIAFHQIAEASEEARAESSSSADIAAQLDAELEATGMTAEERSALAFVSGASFRAMLEAADEDVDQDGRAALDALLSATIEAEARATAQAAAAQETESDATAGLMTALSVALNASADAAAQGADADTVTPVLDTAIEGALEVALALTLEDLVDDATALDTFLGITGELDLDAQTRAEAMGDWLSELRATVEGDLQAAVSEGGDAATIAQTSVATEIWLESEIDAFTETLDADADVEAWAHAMLTSQVFAAPTQQ